MPDDCPSELFALVELATRAQQHANTGPHARHGAHRVAQFLLENRLAELFL